MRLTFRFVTGWIAVCLLLLTVNGCVNDVHRSDVGNEGDEFAIYFVANVALDKVQTMQNVELSQLELEEKPWLSLEDIDYYDLSSHYIYLNEAISIPGEDSTKSFVKPFIVVANGERCYPGYLLSMASSFLPRCPYIRHPAFLADDVVALDISLMDGEVDVRNDTRIIEAFTKAGKLNPGLRITLDDAGVVSREEVTTMSYSFTIINESDNPQYVPDPDKMGSSLFHYYTNGLLLTVADDSHTSYWASEKIVPVLESIETWDISWFTRLDSHESLKRTVQLAGYPFIPDDTYECYFTYSGPGMISRDDRIGPDGRIWLGKVDSNFIKINIEN